MENRPSIFIAMPNMGTLAIGHTQNLMTWALSGKYRWEWKPVTSISPHDRARNECHRLFMESECEYMLFMDADTVPPVDALDKLLAADKDMISATVQTVQSHNGEPRLIPIALRWNEDDKNDVGLKPYIATGIERVDATTLACTLIKRAVMSAVGPRAFQFEYSDEYGTEGCGEDIFFCRKVTEAGFEMWNHYGILCSHFKEFNTVDVNNLMNVACRQGQSKG